MAKHDNALLIEDFYAAFARLDGATMAASYAPDAHFSDPAFTALEGPQVGAMWTMLCKRAADLEVTCKDVVADDLTGSAHWEAVYTFGLTGRKVHNIIEARFEFREGKISSHRDTFGFWRWTRMALGPIKGGLLGWTPMVRNVVRAQASKSLQAFMAQA